MAIWYKTVDLETELLSARRHQVDENLLLDEVRSILNRNEVHRNQIREQIASDEETPENIFVSDKLESDRIFHIDQIRKICIDYRLRFLPTHYFKGGIPEEAVSMVRQLEDLHRNKLGDFHIVAPTKTFQLRDYQDPLLFAPIGNGYFYLVHKWGNELSASRKLWVWPFRNLVTFTVVCIVLSFIITWLTPETKLSKGVPMADAIIFLFAFKSVFAIGMYSFFVLGKKFNASIWDSVYHNN